MRLRPQSELGWLMLQWLAVLVLGHNVQEDPGLLHGSRRGGMALELKHPPATFFKIPGALLNVSREWAEAMGLDADKLEPARK